MLWAWSHPSVKGNMLVIKNTVNTNLDNNNSNNDDKFLAIFSQISLIWGASDTPVILQVQPV